MSINIKCQGFSGFCNAKKKCSVDFSPLAPLSIAQGTYCLAQNYLKGDLTRTLNQKLKYT